ncbi:hypothetical protein MtrunA17_Chr7g0221541 [Medicago truncatula]|uniref:Uncharacterized protein n=1 Tax=Medicago truncatula TaxID=3880 RepID=A0A396H0J1_MEDTR|nr:hypothetical protein MtrunA17_Chr7g0221541 [Medicago truncatula]
MQLTFSKITYYHVQRMLISNIHGIYDYSGFFSNLLMRLMLEVA